MKYTKFLFILLIGVLMTACSTEQVDANIDEQLASEQIVAPNFGKGALCLDHYGSSSNGTRPYLQSCTGDSPQKWYRTGSRIFSSEGKFLDSGRQTSSGARPYLFDYLQFESAQDWGYPKAADSKYVLIRGYGNMCLDTGFVRDRGFEPYLHSCDRNNKAQWFRIR